MRHLFSSRKGQATTETVLLFPVLVIFIVFIIKIFGLLVLSQKMEIAGFYAARRYQLQSHVTDYLTRWDRRYLQKDIKKKVEDYLGFNNPGMVRFLSLRSLKLNVDTSGTWTRVVLTVNTAPPRINFLCKYDKMQYVKMNLPALKGLNFCAKRAAKLK